MNRDIREFVYDSRGNLTSVSGDYFSAGAWHSYTVVSMFDGRDRRVFKSFYDKFTQKTAQWFFYYDALDRLTEVRYTPDSSVAATYSTFQLIWLEGRLVAYWQTDFPTVTTSKRYVAVDEIGRPVDMICWGTGNCPRVWPINPSAWGRRHRLDWRQRLSAHRLCWPIPRYRNRRLAK